MNRTVNIFGQPDGVSHDVCVGDCVFSVDGYRRIGVPYPRGQVNLRRPSFRTPGSMPTGEERFAPSYPHFATADRCSLLRAAHQTPHQGKWMRPQLKYHTIRPLEHKQPGILEIDALRG